MPDPVNPSAMEKITALCHELALRHGLDAETRDELCGHMEDKLLGYLRGDIPIAEADALRLVEAHFGDADVIARGLGGMSLRVRLRRTLAATAGVLMLIMILAVAVPRVISAAMDVKDAPIFPILFGGLATVAVILCVSVALYLAARAAQTKPIERMVAAWVLLATVIGLITALIHLAPTAQSMSVETKLRMDALSSATALTATLPCLILLILLLLPTRRRKMGDLSDRGKHVEPASGQ